jgi:hypothetical protein
MYVQHPGFNPNTTRKEKHKRMVSGSLLYAEEYSKCRMYIHFIFTTAQCNSCNPKYSDKCQVYLYELIYSLKVTYYYVVEVFKVQMIKHSVIPPYTHQYTPMPGFRWKPRMQNLRNSNLRQYR